MKRKRKIKVYPIKREELCQKCKHEVCRYDNCVNCDMYVLKTRSDSLKEITCYCLSIHTGDRCENFKRKEKYK